MLDRILSQLVQLLDSLSDNVHVAFEIIALLWLIQLLNYLLGYRLNFFGIVPRNLFGLICIPFAPLIHGSWSHLLFNSIPLFVFSCFLLISGAQTFIDATLIIGGIAGGLTWLFGRRGVHLGASSIIMGYFSYLSVNAYMHPSVVTWVLAGFCVYFFGSLVTSLFPEEERVSWEGHVFGFVAGLITLWLLK